MSSNKKGPRFFCDNCGTEVPSKAKNCPGCGRYFSSVRCPACGFSAEEERFRQGCPVCGYSTSPAAAQNSGTSPRYKKDPLPFWIYLLVGAVVTAILTVLVFALI